jgi:hypothetical protein
VAAVSAQHLALAADLERERDNLAWIVDQQAETIDDLRRELALAHMHVEMYMGIADGLADQVIPLAPRSQRYRLQVAA